MKKLVAIIGLSLVLGGTALAEDAQPNPKKHHFKKCEGTAEECKAKRQAFREERKKKFLDEKCHGDQACEAQMKQKFEEKHAKIKAAVEQQCGQTPTEECRKQVHQQMMQEFKQKHAQQNAGAAPAPAIK